MAKNNRDDFDQDTIRKAGERVALLCSMCGCITKAASEEGADKVANIGVAAHICAAAPGGKRYDKTMTSAQRKSIENCIWLCQTHAKLIDSDAIKYSREYLEQIKKAAEEKAAKALTEGSKMFEEIQTGEVNFDKIETILNDKVIKGEYIEFKLLLQSLNSLPHKSLGLQNLLEYYQIVYCFYCNREELPYWLSLYISNPVKLYSDQIIGLFTQFFEKELLSKVISFANDEKLKRIAQCVLDDNFLGNIIFEEQEDNNVAKDVDAFEDGCIMHRLATNYAIARGILALKKASGEDIALYDKEFYYKQKAEIFKLARKTINILTAKKESLDNFEEYKSFLENLEKIKSLTPELQVSFWIDILQIAYTIDDDRIYEKFYVECNEIVRKDKRIKSLVYAYEIEKDVKAVSFSEIRRVCEFNQDNRLLKTYLNKMIQVDIKEAEKIFNTHQYLFSQDCTFLEIYIRLKKKKGQINFSPVNFLETYRNIYGENQNFHILIAFFASLNKKRRDLFAKEVSWLDENWSTRSEMFLPFLEMLISVFNTSGKMDKLLELSNLSLPIAFRMRIAECLQKKKSYVPQAKAIYLSIREQEGDSIQGLNRGLFYCHYELGEIDEAKAAICREIDLNPSKEDYGSLLTLRIETKDFDCDKYFEDAKRINDSKIYHLIGISYFYQHTQIAEARYYLLRSLLLDDSNLGGLNAYMSLGLKIKHEEIPSNVVPGVTVRLKNHKKELSVSIHEDGLLFGIKPNRLAGSYHHKESDKAVEDLIYCCVGDEISYKGDRYIIENIDWLETLLIPYAMNQLLLDGKHAYAICGETTEEGIEEIKKLIQKRKDALENVVKIYNDCKGILPVTMLANLLGTKYLGAYNFILHENTERLRNLNSSLIINDETEYILSLETVYVLALLDIDVSLLKKSNTYLSLFTRRVLLAEISEYIDDCKNKANVGQLYLRDGTLYREDKTQELLNQRLRFFNRMKRIVENLPTVDTQYTYNIENELKSIFRDNKLILEGDIIGLMIAKPTAVLVTDDAFLTSLIGLHHINAIGMNRFLLSLGLSFDKHLQCVRQLARLKWGNYLTEDVYDHFSKIILQEEDKQAQEKYFHDFMDLLAGDYLKGTNESLWRYNNALIRNLLSFKLPERDVNFVNRGLADVYLYNYSIEFPEEYKSLTEKWKSRFKIRMVENNGEWYYEPYIEEEDEYCKKKD